MDLSIGTKTDSGQRPNNEDYLAVIDTRKYNLRGDGVLIIADGMGGRNFGEKASEVTVQTLMTTLGELLSKDSGNPVSISEALISSFRAANSDVYKIAQSDPECEGMGTTCVVAVISDGCLYLGHVGDSRAYFLRNDVLEQLTEDHSYVAEQVRAGQMTEEKARTSRFRNIITRAVGIEDDIVPDLLEYSLEGVDAIVLCTDGLTNMVSDNDISQIVALAPTAQTAADWLVALANRNGGLDNISAVVARLGVTPELDRRGTLAVTPDLPEDAYGADTDDGSPIDGLRRLPIGLIVSTFLVTFLVVVVIYFVGVLSRTGYRVPASPPFVMRPAPAFRTPSINLAEVLYDAPKTIYPSQLQGDVLTRNPEDGSLTALSTNGEVMHITADGQPISQIKPNQDSKISAATGAASSSLGTGHNNLHSVNDRQGNRYVADASSRVITKYKANGEIIVSVAKGKLQRPEAIAIGDDGTVYVIDAGWLKVIRARPV